MVSFRRRCVSSVVLHDTGPGPDVIIHEYVPEFDTLYLEKIFESELLPKIVLTLSGVRSTEILSCSRSPLAAHHTSCLLYSAKPGGSVEP